MNRRFVGTVVGFCGSRWERWSMRCRHTRLGRHIAGQLVRSGTSAGAELRRRMRGRKPRRFRSQTEHLSEGTARIAILDSIDYRKRIAAEEEDDATCWTNATQLCKIIAQSIVTAKSKVAKENDRDELPHFALCNLHFAFCNFQFAIKKAMPCPSTATPTKPAPAQNIGRVTQVIGSTFDVEFPEHHLPAIYNAVKITSQQKGITLNLTGEVQQHLGGGRVRCVALGSTDGMVRGMDCLDTGSPGQGAGRQMHARPRVQSDRRRDRRPRADRGRGLLAHPPRRARGDRPLDPDRNLRDRHQGDRPADAVRPRRQGGPVRRGRLGQNRHPHRTDRANRHRPTAATPSSPASASEPARATTSGSKCSSRRSATPAATSSTRRAWSSAR